MTALGRLVVLAPLLVGAPTGAAWAGDVAVVVTGVPNDQGSVRLSVCDRARFLGDCAFNRRVAARRGAVDITVPGVPPGRFAVMAHHDENANDRVDTNLFGAPTEAIGFSNDPSARWGPPRFDESAIEVTDAPLALRITLRR
jgi:uncharacterized protein (DUF2141 family)